MQFDEQEMRGEKKVGFMNPMKICEDRHIFKIGKENEELKGLKPEEAEVKKEKLKKEFENNYAFYLGHAMLKFQDRNCKVAPYNFG